MIRAARAGIALAAACFCLASTGPALARSKHRHHEHKSHHHHHRHEDGGSMSEGKAHLKRAHVLAGDGDCAAAIKEYTKAYERLNDPVVLFNRAECYRRVDDSEKAADDYHAFLEKVPNAPNRAEIEAKLVALEAPEPSPQGEKPAEAPPPSKTAEGPPAPPKSAEAPPAPPKVAEAPPPAPKPESKPAPAVVVQQPANRVDSEPPGGSRPWVWVALSVLTIGAGVAGYLVFRPHDQPPPETALGNYRF